MRFNGTSWESMGNGSAAPLYGVAITSRGDAYAVGDAGTILKLDGVTWNPMHSGFYKPLRGVCSGPTQDVYAVGETGTILHYGL